MEQSKIDMFIAANADNFLPQDLVIIRNKLGEINDSKYYQALSAGYQKPSTILLLAIFLGWERFWLDDVALGLLKIFTGGGCGIWYVIDIFSATDRARKYNYVKFMRAISAK